MSRVVPEALRLHATRIVPERVEPIHLLAETHYDLPSARIVLSVRNTVVDGKTTSVVKREVLFDEDAFTAEERRQLARLLGSFVAEARGGKLVP